MFSQLIASAPHRCRTRPGAAGTMTSLALHGALVVAAVQATLPNRSEVHPARTDTMPIMFVAKHKSEQRTTERVAQPRALDLPNPVPFGFKLVDPPVIVPSEIPPVDGNTDFDLRDYTGIGTPGGAFDGLRGEVAPDLSQTFAAMAVDEPPRRIAGPLPRYPEVLRQAGIEGTVVLQFVVDTTGRVEESTIEVLRTTNRAFVAPAVVVVTKSLFRPGRMRGRAVRVLVSLPIGFALDSRR
jgi:protein TonB